MNVATAIELFGLDVCFCVRSRKKEEGKHSPQTSHYIAINIQERGDEMRGGVKDWKSIDN